jgi:hypothetical protein
MTLQKKFGCYNCVRVLNESKTTLEDVISKALQLYKLKHLNNASFLFLHCWLLLKEMFRWSNSMEAKKTPPPKCKTLDQDLTLVEMQELQDYEARGLCSENGDHKLFMLTTIFKGIKGRSKECKVQRMCFVCSSKTIVDMVVAMRKKVEILENQVAFQLFTMLEKLITRPKTHEYLLLWRCEVLERLWHPVGTLHTSGDATIVDTNNIIATPSSLHVR